MMARSVGISTHSHQQSDSSPTGTAAAYITSRSQPHVAIETRCRRAPPATGPGQPPLSSELRVVRSLAVWPGWTPTYPGTPQLHWLPTSLSPDPTRSLRPSPVPRVWPDSGAAVHVRNAARLGESVQCRRWRSGLAGPSDPACGCLDWLACPAAQRATPSSWIVTTLIQSNQPFSRKGPKDRWT
jgi:hypothetical protein